MATTEGVLACCAWFVVCECEATPRNSGQCWKCVLEPYHCQISTIIAHIWKWLVAQWLKRASQGHEMYCHDVEVVGSNPSQVKLGVHSAFVQVRYDLNIKPFQELTVYCNMGSRANIWNIDNHVLLDAGSYCQSQITVQLEGWYGALYAVLCYTTYRINKCTSATSYHCSYDRLSRLFTMY